MPKLSRRLVAAALTLALGGRLGEARGLEAAEPRRAPTVDDLLRVKTVAGVAVSPDGRAVAYGVREADLAQDAYVTRVWLAAAEASPIPLTASLKNVSLFRWSPDGRLLAFLSSHEKDKDQLFVISPAGGEATRLTRSETAISDFAWSRDGRQIVFVAEEPESPAAKARKERFGDYAVVRREYAYRHLFTLDVLEAMKAPVTGTQRTRGREWSVQDPSFSPDGREVAFAATRSPDLVEGATSDVYVLRLADDSVRRVVSQAGPDSNPVWSPDGQKLAFSTQMGRTRYYATNQQIAVVEASGGAPRLLTDAFDEDAELLDWLPDGIYFSGLQKTAGHLFRVPAEGGPVSRVSAPDHLLGLAFSVSADGRAVAFTAGSPTGLAEVFLSPLPRFAPRPLTNLSAQVAGLALGTREVVSWKSRDGTTIEGVLVKPQGFDPARKHPLLCVIHGGPTGIDRPIASDLRYYPTDVWTARGALVLKVNYRGSAGYGERFRTLNYGNLGVGDAWDVLSGIDHLIAQGFVDPQRLGCMGWSQGGYISAFLTTSTDRFRAISVGAGISNWATYYYNTDITPFTIQYLGKDPAADPAVYRKTSPMTHVLQARTPTLIQHGENDRRVPIANAFELRQGLEDRGVPVEMVVYKGFGHGITKPKAMRAVMQHNVSWFGHYLWGDPRPDLTAPDTREALRAAYQAMTAAHKAGDWPTMLARSQEVVALAPRSARARYSLARAESRNGRLAESVLSLGWLADRGVGFDLAADPDLAPLRGRPDFEAVVGRMQALLAPVGGSPEAFTLAEKDLLTEGVVHDPKTGAFFVSSVHRRKVVRVEASGRASDFVTEGQDGLFAAQALAVDPARRALYVSSEAQSLMRGYRKEDEGRSLVFEFDLDDGRLRRRLPLPGPSAHAGDLAVGPDGALYVADPQKGRVYRLRPGASALEVLVPEGSLGSAQGLAASADGSFLFVADYTQGIARVELSSGRVSFLETPERLLVTGVDGLVLAGDSLVAIQNGLEPHRVLRLRLGEGGTRILEGTILERAHPRFDEPTLGVRVGADFYYVANSQYGAFREDGTIDEAQLRAPTVLRLPLPWVGDH